MSRKIFPPSNHSDSLFSSFERSRYAAEYLLGIDPRNIKQSNVAIACFALILAREAEITDPLGGQTLLATVKEVFSGLEMRDPVLHSLSQETLQTRIADYSSIIGQIVEVRASSPVDFVA